MKNISRARQLRRNSTDAERLLWSQLRDRRLMGLKFRRQRPMGPYVLDFVCIERKLVIELDGGQHQERTDYDERRTRWLRSRGYAVLRFWNNEVFEDIDAVLDAILLVLGGRPPNHPHPRIKYGAGSDLLPQGRRDKAGDVPSPCPLPGCTYILGEGKIFSFPLP